MTFSMPEPPNIPEGFSSIEEVWAFCGRLARYQQDLYEFLVSLRRNVRGKAESSHTQSISTITGLGTGVSGARNDPESALANLLARLDADGIITDNTTAT